jgi:hypothetical protein
MKNHKLPTAGKGRKGERGAALIMVLMISALLLVAVGGLLMEASKHTANVTDATAEEQAYYAAESGIQTVVNILRGNTVLPNSLRLDTSKPNTDPANKINYFRALKLDTSNASSPTAAQCASSTPPLDCNARLSRWMSYDSTLTDRVILGNSASYGYSIQLINPDNLGNTISYTTSITFDGVATNSKTWTSIIPANSATLTYVPITTATNVDVSTGQGVTNFGRFQLTSTGTGVLSFTRTRFSITVNFTQPWIASKIIKGYIESGAITGASTTAWILYDSPSYIVNGSSIVLSDGADYADTTPLPPPDSYYRVGYRVPLVAPTLTGAGESSAGTKSVNGTITAPEPHRLLIRSTGYGPMGAKKQLEAFIQKNYFNDLGAPSPLTLIGPPCTPVGTCTPQAPTSTWTAPNMVFNPGTSTGTHYDGRDVLNHGYLPPIGVTNDNNFNEIRYGLTHGPPQKYNGSIWGNVDNVAADLPFWLQSPANLNATLLQLKSVAQATGRYYGPGVSPPGNGGYGSATAATGITYIDGDLSFSGEGGGILIVTGQLTFQGGFDWNGLIVVTGAGGIARNGGGGGTLEGNLIVAPYTDPTATTLAGFLAPRYDISGGGTSEIAYNSGNVLAGLGALSNFVKGVAEK